MVAFIFIFRDIFLGNYIQPCTTKHERTPRFPDRLIHQPEKAFSFTRLPNFLFEAPTFRPLSNEAKVLYAFILRRTELSRKNGWADDCGRIFLYYPICEVVDLLHCGRQKAVNTLRELQYAGLVEIQKQGCGKPNRIYPKSYEAVPNTDFKKSGSGTPEG